MSTPAPLLPLEKLLAPVSADAPAGPHLRHEAGRENTYDGIQEARREDDFSLLKDIGPQRFKHAQWQRVDQLCQEGLLRSKDLQLAAWLTEARLEQQGLAGLADGLRLLAALSERFWDNAWPALEQGDATGRLSVLDWIDKKVTPKLKRIALSQPTGGGAGACYTDWERILYREKHEARLREAGPAREESQPLTRQGFESALRLTPPAFYTSLGRALTEVRDSALEVERVCDTHLKEERNVLSQLRSMLGDIRTALEPVRALLEPAAPPPPPGEPPSTPGQPPAIGPAAPRGAIQSRAEAYQLLTEASDYLLRTEPHSPTPYLVKRAVQWGEMPLGQLLGEIVPSSDNLKSIFSLLAIRDAK